MKCGEKSWSCDFWAIITQSKCKMMSTKLTETALGYSPCRSSLLLASNAGVSPTLVLAEDARTMLFGLRFLWLDRGVPDADERPPPKSIVGKLLDFRQKWKIFGKCRQGGQKRPNLWWLLEEVGKCQWNFRDKKSSKRSTFFTSVWVNKIWIDLI